MTFASPELLLGLLLVPLGARGLRAGPAPPRRATPFGSRTSICCRTSRRGRRPGAATSRRRSISVRSPPSRSPSPVPRWSLQSRGKRRPIIMTMDVSASMRATDVDPSRLEGSQEGRLRLRRPAPGAVQGRPCRILDGCPARPGTDRRSSGDPPRDRPAPEPTAGRPSATRSRCRSRRPAWARPALPGYRHRDGTRAVGLGRPELRVGSGGPRGRTTAGRDRPALGRRELDRQPRAAGGGGQGSCGRRAGLHDRARDPLSGVVDVPDQQGGHPLARGPARPGDPGGDRRNDRRSVLRGADVGRPGPDLREPRLEDWAAPRRNRRSPSGSPRPASCSSSAARASRPSGSTASVIRTPARSSQFAGVMLRRSQPCAGVDDLRRESVPGRRISPG